MGLTSVREISTISRLTQFIPLKRKEESSVSPFTLELEGLVAGIQLETTQAPGLTPSIKLTDHAFIDDIRIQLEKQLQLPDWTNLVKGRVVEGSLDICPSTPEGRDDYSRAINGREVSRLRNPRGSADIDPATEEGKAEHKTFFRNLQLLDPDRAGISAKIEAGTSVKNQIVKFNRRKNWLFWEMSESKIIK